MSEEMVIVAHQHLLPSVLPFLHKVKSHLSEPSNLFVVGKPYSTIPHVEQQLVESGVTVVPTSKYDGELGDYYSGINHMLSTLWDKVEEYISDKSGRRLILIDEGGWLYSTVPEQLKENVVSCIEQTSSGIRKQFSDLPVISVAESAAKRYFESPFIAKAIISKLQSQGFSAQGNRIGIIGKGFLGSALHTHLIGMGLNISCYDINNDGSESDQNSIGRLISESDLILGCVGEDVLNPEIDLEGITGEKVFVSCSSGDVEFNRMIRALAEHKDNLSPFSDIKGSANNGQLKITVLNGGYPINFDREKEWEEPQEIQLTRDLMQAALKQVLTVREARGVVMLDPNKQIDVTKHWLRQSGHDTDSVDWQPTWWADHSSGRLPASYSKEDFMDNQYHTHWTTPGFLERMREHKEPYAFELQGREVLVHPDVFSPYYDWSSELAIENLLDVKGKTVLEVGCGSGVISLFCFLNGASFVTSVDINPAAIENTKENLERNGAVNFQCFESDVFSNVTGQFDLIIFNAPYHGNEPADILEYAVSDPNYRALSLFLSGVRQYLTENGKVQLGFSESGDVDLMNRLIEENGLTIEWMRDSFRKEYNAQVYFLKP